MDVKPSRIRLRIEELVLSGFSAADGAALRRAMERELTRLVASRGVDGARAGGRARLDGGTLRVPPRTPPRQLGRRLARSLYDRALAPAPAPRPRGVPAAKRGES